MKCHWSFENTMNGKTQNIAIKGNTKMLMNVGHFHKKEPTQLAKRYNKGKPNGLGFPKTFHVDQLVCHSFHIKDF